MVTTVDGNFAATVTIENSEQSLIFVVHEFKVDEMRVLLNLVR